MSKRISFDRAFLQSPELLAGGDADHNKLRLDFLIPKQDSVSLLEQAAEIAKLRVRVTIEVISNQD